MDYQSIVTFVMEMAGSVAFAASGAMVGKKETVKRQTFYNSIMKYVTAF